MSTISKILAETRALIFREEFKSEARKKPTYFTRNRKMSFEELMIFMLLSLKCSVPSALRRFFADMGKKTTTMTQQSLSEARQKLNVTAFVRLFRITVDVMAGDFDKKWHNYRIYAIDGSKIALPSENELREYYGSLGKEGSSPTAQGSVLYDVLNDIVVDAAIEPMSVDERTLAKKHLDVLKSTPITDKKLIIFDRGYASFELIERLENDGCAYVIRVKTKFNKEIDVQSKPDGFVWLSKNEKKIRVRVIKLKLDSGETETLVTNIEDRRLGVKAFKKLYFLRWPVEIKYDIVKNKLQLENFNTRTIEGVQQDFFAAMYLVNFVAATAAEAQAEIELSRVNKNNKYSYKANTNELIGILKDRFVFALSQDDPAEQTLQLESILDEVKRYVIPVRPDRSVLRNPSPRKCKFHHNQKANC